MHKSMKKWRVPLLLALALLIAGIVAIATLTGAADAPEIDRIGVQAYSSLDLANDSNTDLRFICRIHSLDYSAVGFVFSKTDSTPEIGEDGCANKATTTVYSSITADGINESASDGYWWVAVKLTGIPHSFFDGTLYVRAYVTDGAGTRYSDVVTPTVCIAKGHTHTVSLQYSGTASMTAEGDSIGYCKGCKLYNVTQHGVQNACEGKMWEADGKQDSWVDSRQISTVLAGGKHFYPDASNNFEGNDLVVEYSILWNETLLNMMPRYTYTVTKNGKTTTYNRDAVVLTTFATSEYGYDNYRSLGYWGLTDNVPGSGAQIAGAFEYPNPMIQTNEPGTPYAGMNADGGIYSDYPNVGGTVIKNPEYGWHRIGIVYHEDVINLDAVRDNDAAAQYKLTVTLYIDGEVVSVLSGSNLTSEGGSEDYKLYTVRKEGGKLIYEDIDSDYYIYLFGIRNTKANTTGTDVYFIDGDAFVNAGHGFVQNVKRIDNPKSRSETVTSGDNFDSKTFATAPFYYTTGDFCVSHTWDADYTAGKAATLVAKGTKIDHCSFCGIARESVDNTTSATVLSDTWTTGSTGSYPSSSTDTSSPLTFNILTDILDGGKNAFYPTAGNPEGSDLLIEYSILWNPTLLNLDPGSGNATGAPYIGTGIHNDTGLNQFNNIMYWSPTTNMPYSGCKSAGGIEYASFTTNESGNPYPNMIKDGKDVTKYPNIGGNNDGDGQTQAQDQYGWHRVQIRVHEDVTNLAALKASKTKNSPAATYKLTAYIYIDGVLVSVLSDTTKLKDNNNLLYTASADGSGSVTYGTVQSDRILNAVRANLTTAASDSVYFSVADVSAVCGHDFVQQVQRVQHPDGGTEDHYSHVLYYASADDEAVNVLTTSTNGSFGVKKNIVYDILKGDHFYPTESDPEGKDLYVEYSILWSEDLKNYMDASSSPYIDTRIGNSFGGNSKALSYWSLAGGMSYSGCKHAGGFEYTGLKVSEDGNPYPNMIKDEQAITKYPNIGGANNGDGQTQVNTRYGWHRIGMQFHQDVTNLAALKADDVGGVVAAQYKVTCRLYIDGKLVSILSDGPAEWIQADLLYTAESDGEGGVTYTDIGADRWLYIFRLNSSTTSESTAEFTYKDCYATAGHSFVQQVSQLDAASDSHWYSIASHSHDYYYEIIEAANLLNDGTRRQVCAICGAYGDAETYAYEPYFRTLTTDNDNEGLGDRKYLRDIQGNKHFYPTDGNPDGNDLLVEYSVLWNWTLVDRFGGGSSTPTSPFVSTKLSRWDGSQDNNLVYWSLTNNVNDAYCKFAGGFETGHAANIGENTPPGMGSKVNNYSAYPNIGGTTASNVSELDNGHEWGWHCIQMRMHQEVINAEALEADTKANATAARYRVTITTYVDGEFISELYREGTGSQMFNSDGSNTNLLYRAESDGKGGITYKDNPKLTSGDKYQRAVWAYKVNYTQTSTGNAYWGDADVYYTCGHKFSQNIEKVASPDYVAYEIAPGVEVNGAIYYRFK